MMAYIEAEVHSAHSWPTVSDVSCGRQGGGAEAQWLGEKVRCGQQLDKQPSLQAGLLAAHACIAQRSPGTCWTGPGK